MSDPAPSTPNKTRNWLIITTIALLGTSAGIIAWTWKDLQAGRLAERINTDADPEQRIAAAQKLMQLCPAGQSRVHQILTSGTPEGIEALRVTWNQENLPWPKDAWESLFTRVEEYQPAGQQAMLEVANRLLNTHDHEWIPPCQTLVQKLLTGGDEGTRVQAMRFALEPKLGMKASLIPCLQDPSARVRRAALLVLAPLPADNSAPLVPDDDLFRALHDSDWEVRALCEAGLGTRGFTIEQIEYARKLSSPKVDDRLNLLNDLMYAPDPSPWLKRLGRDPEPAVRAGTLRVGYEARLNFTEWLDTIMTQEPDLTVRRVGQFYRQKAQELKQTSFNR